MPRSLKPASSALDGHNWAQKGVMGTDGCVKVRHGTGSATKRRSGTSLRTMRGMIAGRRSLVGESDWRFGR